MIILGLTAQASAYPGMDRVLNEIRTRDNYIAQRSTDLLGDLLRGAVTEVGKLIQSILQGGSAQANDPSYKAPGPLGSDACAKDTCCTWSYVVADLQKSFVDSNGCTSLARGAIRQGFHGEYSSSYLPLPD